jgi:C-terminal processing protease CtpA/Prc
MVDRPIHSSAWDYYDITGDIDPDASVINFGVMSFGRGAVYIDDASLDAVPAIPAYTVPANASFDRLTAAAKLWVYIKYLHTRVTASEVDWDRAFVNAAPKILESKNETEFAAALDGMLAALHDPTTHVLAPPKPPMRIVPAVQPGVPGVHVVIFKPGTYAEAMAAANSLPQELGYKPSVVFDLRGASISDWLPDSAFAFGAAWTAPPTTGRIHWGYAPQTPGAIYQGYYSAWETRDGQSHPGGPSNAIAPVFLVDRKTVIPEAALAAQTAGIGAIVSEEPLLDQEPVTTNVPVGNLIVAVRTREIAYPDGTTGVQPNVVLNQTGDAALQAAIEIAKSGKWPAPPPRPKLTLPPAVFTEKQYTAQYPSTELRMLAAARIWGVFNYFHPYKYLYGEDWDAVLATYLPILAAAKDAREYQLAVAEMVTHTHDTHCFVSSAQLSTYQGSRAPLEVRWIENQPVVTRVVDPELAKTIHSGDILIKIDGQPYRKRIDELSLVLTASTPQSLTNRVMQLLLSAPESAETPVTFRAADGQEYEAKLEHNSAFAQHLYPSRTGETYHLLTPTIGYVDLEKLTNAQVDAMFDTFKNTTALIMDMRGYPQGTAWSIAPRLADQPGKVNAQFRTNVVSAAYVEGGLRQEFFEQRIPVIDKPRYTGKTIMLIDDRAISQSEHSGLMYKTANGTVFIGSPTAGANGDVTSFTAPGGIRISFSGHDVRWPDGKQLQRVGLLPDIEVKPTIAGIRAGRDEVLERAVQYAEHGQ